MEMKLSLEQLEEIVDWIDKVLPLDITVIGYLGYGQKEIMFGKRHYTRTGKHKIWMPHPDFIIPSTQDRQRNYYQTRPYAIELFGYSPELFFKAAHLDSVFLALASSPQDALIAAISEEIVTDKLKYRFRFYGKWT